MNEEALQTLYGLAQNEGYTKSFDDFKILMGSNEDAVNAMYGVSKNEGYTKSFDDFKTLVGFSNQQELVDLKKKEDIASVGASGMSDGLQTEQTPVIEEDFTLGTLSADDPERTPVVYDSKQMDVSPSMVQEVAKSDITGQQIIKAEQERVQREKEDPFGEALKRIDIKGKTEEELVPELNYLLGDYGFNFEEAGLGNQVKITAPNGEQKTVDFGEITELIDPTGLVMDKGFLSYFQEQIFGREEEEKEIVDFLKQNQDMSINIENQRKKILTENEYNAYTNTFNQEAKDFLSKKKELDAKTADTLNRGKKITPNTPEYKAYLEEVRSINQMKLELEKQYNTLKDKGKEYDAVVGEYAMMRADQGGFLGSLVDSAKRGIGGAAAGIVDLALTLGANVSYYSYAGQFMGEDGDKALKEFKYGKEEKFVNPFSKKATAASRDTDKGVVEAIRELPLAATGGRMSTKEYIEEQQKADLFSLKGLAAVANGVAEFVPVTMLSGGIGTVALSSQYVIDEMNDNPAFDNISEAEKSAVALSIGSVIGVLERVGFKNVMQSKTFTPFVNSVATKVLAKNPATMKTFNELVTQEVKSSIAKGALRLGAGFAAEFETGALQEIADISMKEVYNAVKEADMFETPETIGQAINQVIMGGIAEGLGGGMMATPRAMSSAFSKNDLSNIDSKTFNMFEMMSKDSKYLDMVTEKLNQQVVNGDITKKQRDKILSDYNRMNGAMQKMPKGIKSSQKKQLLGLFMEHQSLTEQMETKDDVFNKRAKEKKKEIESRIDALLKDNEIETSVEQVLNTTPEETQVFYAERLEDVPEKYRDRAEKVENDEGEITFKDNILGLPIGKERKVKVGEYYTYTLNGTEIEEVIEQETESEEIDKSKESRLDSLFSQVEGKKKEKGEKKVSEVLGTQVVIDGKEGILKQDGEQIIFETIEVDPEAQKEIEQLESSKRRLEKSEKMRGYDVSKAKLNKEYDEKIAELKNKTIKRETELGNTKELMFAPLSELGAKEVELAPAERVEFEGNEFVSPPVETTKGDVISGKMKLVSSKTDKKGRRVVTVIDSNGLKRRFTGDAAEQIIKSYKTQEVQPEGDYFSSRPPQGTVRASEKVSIIMSGAELSDRKRAKYERIVDMAVKAMDAIGTILPDVKILVHSSPVTFEQELGFSDARGAFDPNTNTIHINLAYAKTTTVGHEVLHAILINKLRSDKRVGAAVNEMIDSIKKSVGADVAKKLDNFAKQYKGKVKNEEYIAELFGILSDNYNSLGSKAKSAIRDFIRKIRSIFNLPQDATIRDQQVFDFVDTLARKVGEGEVVLEEDIAMLAEPSKTDAEITPSIRKQKLKDEKEIQRIRAANISGNRVGKGLSKKGSKNPIFEDSTELSVEYARQNPNLYINNANILAKEPIVRAKLKIDNVKTIEQADKIYDVFVREAANNLKFLSSEFKEEYRETSTLWYDGANKIARDLSKKYNVTPEQAAGILASLSPQKDWYQNVRLAELVLMAYSDNAIMSEDMINKQIEINENSIKNSQLKKYNKAKQNYIKSRSKSNKQKLDEAKLNLEERKNKLNDIIDYLKSQKGKTILEVSPNFQSFWVRLHHEINTTKDYDIVSPDGEKINVAKRNDGVNKKVAWGSYTEIGKAVSIYNDGSQENITRTLGEMHKIRNFYNNIIDPMSKDGDVTIDTHAVAAALLEPLSGKSKKVTANFGTGTSNSAPLGIKGLYYAYSDAYALAAEELNLLPRQVQSITWEAIRGLYTDTFKNNSRNVDSIQKIWEDYGNGKITINEARSSAIKEAGGINDPTWASPGTKLSEKGSDAVSKSGREGSRGVDKTSVRSSRGRGDVTFGETADIRKQKLLAPNGKPSNLTPELYKLVRTTEFKNWFGDWENDPTNASKVVDENGEPMVVYHGSPSPEITVFDRSKSPKSSGLRMLGHYFTTNKLIADVYRKSRRTKEYESYVRDRIQELDIALERVTNNRDFEYLLKISEEFKRGKIYPVFLNIRDMVTFNANKETFDTSWRNLKVDVGYDIKTEAEAVEVYAGKNPMALDKKVDGIKAEDIIELNSYSNIYNINDYVGDAYLIFDENPENIKLADGSNLTFDPENPDIRFQKKSSIKQIIKEAKKQGFTTQEIKEFLMKNKGFTKAEVDALFPKRKPKKTPKKPTKKTIIQMIKEKAKDSKGRISKGYTNQLINQASKLDYDDPIAVDAFIEKVKKIYDRASYVQNLIDAKKNRAAAKKAVKRKFGASVKSMLDIAEKILSVDVQYLSDELLDEYNEVIGVLGKREGIKIIDDIKEYTLKLEALAEKIKEELDEQIEEEVPTSPSAASKRRKENIEQIKKKRKSIKNELSNKYEKELADVLLSVTDEQLEMMTDENIDKLNKLLSQIERGYISTDAGTSMRTVIKGKIEGGKILVDNVNMEKAGKFYVNSFAKIYAKFKSLFDKDTPLLSMIRSTITSEIDSIFGNFNARDIYDATFGKLSSYKDRYDHEINKILVKIDDFNNLLTGGKIFQKSTNEQMLSRFRIMASLLQDEYLSNPEKNGVAPALEFIEATAKHLEDGNQVDKIESKILMKLKEEIESNNGEIILSKKEQKAKNIIKEINDGLTDKFMYVAAARGERPTIYNNYIHHSALYTLENQKKGINNQLSSFNRVSTKPGTIEERSSHNRVISFDPAFSTTMGAKQTLLDFYMDQPIKEVRAAIDTLKESKRKGDRDAAIALEKALNESLEIVLSNQLSYYGFGEAVFDKIRKISYYATLGSIPRAAAELGSNMLYITIYNPSSWTKGATKYFYLSTGIEGAELMYSVGSEVTTKNFNKEALAGGRTDALNFSRQSFSSSRAKGRLGNAIHFIKSNTLVLPALEKSTDFIGSYLLSTPDKAASRPLWFGTFFGELESLTGRTFSKEEIQEMASGESKLLTEYKTEIEAARKKADKENVQMASSGNAFNTILKDNIRYTGDKAGFRNIYRAINTYMAKFMKNEFNTAKSAINALFNSGDISRPEAVRLTIAVTTRMTAYMVLYTLFRDIFESMFGFDDDEDTDYEALTYRQLVGSTSTLLTRRYLGNIPALPISLMTEMANEEYLDELRNGEEYDPFKNSIVYSPVNIKDFKEKHPYDTWLSTFGGPIGHLAKSAARAQKVVAMSQTARTEETRDKYKKEFLKRTTIEAMGNLGLLPFYKDIRNLVIKDLFEEKESKSLILTDSEKKKYSPKLYKREQEFKKRFERTSAYKNQQKMKAIKKQKRREMLKRRFGQ